MTGITRAERRHRRQRAVAYARKKLKEWGIKPDRAALWADNMCKCSCDMCTAQSHRPQHIDYADEFDWSA